jgi:hypothetical protein
MKKCKRCNEYHPSDHPHFTVVNKLSQKGFPVHAKGIEEAHEKANKAEEKRFGKQFAQLEPFLQRAGHQHTLIGKNLPSGKLEVAKSVPPKFRNEVAFHEEVENHYLRKK